MVYQQNSAAKTGRRSWLGAGLIAVLAMPQLALATISYGDFAATGLDFIQVSETTNSAGDPAALVGAPTLQPDELVFSPTVFTSSAAADASDITSTLLTVDLNAHLGYVLSGLTISGSGDTTLTKLPPFGDPTTNSGASAAGTLTVFSDLGGPIAPVVIPYVGIFSPSNTFSLPGDFGATDWSFQLLVDVAAVVPNATSASLSLDLSLLTNAGSGASSTIELKTLNIAATMTPTGPAPMPLPSSLALLLIGLFGARLARAA